MKPIRDSLKEMLSPAGLPERVYDLKERTELEWCARDGAYVTPDRRWYYLAYVVRDQLGVRFIASPPKPRQMALFNASAQRYGGGRRIERPHTDRMVSEDEMINR